jgi:hypothetical protein
METKEDQINEFNMIEKQQLSILSQKSKHSNNEDSIRSHTVVPKSNCFNSIYISSHIIAIRPLYYRLHNVKVQEEKDFKETLYLRVIPKSECLNQIQTAFTQLEQYIKSLIPIKSLVILRSSWKKREQKFESSSSFLYPLSMVVKYNPFSHDTHSINIKHARDITICCYMIVISKENIAYAHFTYIESDHNEQKLRNDEMFKLFVEGSISHKEKEKE